MKKILMMAGLLVTVNMHSAIEKVTDANFESKTSKGKVVVKFYKDGCHFCEAAEKVYVPLSQDPRYKHITFLKIDAEAPNSEKTADQYGISGLPTFVFFKDGTMVSKSKSGVTSKESIEAEFRKAGFIK